MDKDITAVIKTFMRPEKFKVCLDATIKTGINKIVVGYDGPDELLNIHKKIVEKQFKHANIKFCVYPFNIGISVVRNSLLQFVDTKYLLQLDDDVAIPRNVLDVIPFLEEHDEIGAVGIGQLPLVKRCLPLIEAFDIEIVNKYLFRTFDDGKYYEINNDLLFMGYFDFIPNNAVFKRELFNNVKWDNNFVIWGDHVDFFLQAKYNTKWKFAVCMSLYSIHDAGGDTNFKVYRYGIESIKAKHYLYKKWNIKGMIPNNPVPYLLDGDYYFNSIIRQNETTVEKINEDKILPKYYINAPNEHYL